MVCALISQPHTLRSDPLMQIGASKWFSCPPLASNCHLSSSKRNIGHQRSLAAQLLPQVVRCSREQNSLEYLCFQKKDHDILCKLKLDIKEPSASAFLKSSSSAPRSYLLCYRPLHSFKSAFAASSCARLAHTDA